MTGMFLALDDFIGRGVEKTLDHLDGLGITELMLAVSYHSARDITPHGASKVVHRKPGIYFSPRPDAFAGSRLHPSVVGDDALCRLVIERAHTRNMTVIAWVVYCHNEEIGTRTPSVTSHNCFGDDASHADLCPSNPQVVQYISELTDEVCALGVDGIAAESLHFSGLNHGYHHERSAVRLGAFEEFVLGMCFCKHCASHAEHEGVDVAEARRRAQEFLVARFQGAENVTLALTRGTFRDVCGDALADYAAARSHTVGRVTQAVCDIAGTHSLGVTFLDNTGAVKGYSNGEPGEGSAREEGWQAGIDLADVSTIADIGLLAYARDPDRVESETLSYRQAIDSESRLRVVLRPSAPDCDRTDNLQAKVAGVRRANADAIDFYHYGLCSIPDLERIAYSSLVSSGSAT